MHESLRLYDAALDILALESEALDNEDDERLAELYKNRLTFMENGWEKRAGCDVTLLSERLEAIQKAQAVIAHRANMQKETLRMALQSNRRENTRLAGYEKTVTHRQSALLVSKEG